jgi:hypothetical protein
MRLLQSRMLVWYKTINMSLLTEPPSEPRALCMPSCSKLAPVLAWII